MNRLRYLKQFTNNVNWPQKNFGWTEIYLFQGTNSGGRKVQFSKDTKGDFSGKFLINLIFHKKPYLPPGAHLGKLVNDFNTIKNFT